MNLPKFHHLATVTPSSLRSCGMQTSQTSSLDRCGCDVCICIPELGTPHYKGQNVGSQLRPLQRVSTVCTKNVLKKTLAEVQIILIVLFCGYKSCMNQYSGMKSKQYFMEMILVLQQEHNEPKTMSSRNMEVYIACLIVCALQKTRAHKNGQLE